MDDRQTWQRRAALALKHWQRVPVNMTDHDAIMAHLAEEGGISAQFCVMTLLSCGIAILGLLLSSPAVVIGAMLISPLMSPIILSGFSLATLDYGLMARSLMTLALGTVLAMALSASIVWLSPLNAVTPEILARTRPNFFDLLVAVFSAIAGAYAVVKRKGETIVGVAIATALMPPLAVVGYGLATRNWAIFGGAAGLFLTNMLAISLTASLVARFFGFGSYQHKKHEAWQTVAILAAFAVLSAPLGLSLRQLAREGLMTAHARTTLNEMFPGPENHIYGMNIAFPENKAIEIDALVLTSHMQPGAEQRAQHYLARRLGAPVTLTLSQTPVHARESLDRQAVEQMMRQADENLVRKIQPDMTSVAASETGATRLQVSQDPESRTVLVRLAANGFAQLKALHDAQSRLAAQHPEWSFAIRPDPDALPEIGFAPGATALDAEGKQDTQLVIWALQASKVKSVQVTGHSDNAGSTALNRRRAAARAAAVGDLLSQAGFAVTLTAVYPLPNQRAQERERGQAFFRQVQVQPKPE